MQSQKGEVPFDNEKWQLNSAVLSASQTGVNFRKKTPVLTLFADQRSSQERLKQRPFESEQVTAQASYNDEDQDGGESSQQVRVPDQPNVKSYQSSQSTSRHALSRKLTLNGTSKQFGINTGTFHFHNLNSNKRKSANR